MDVNIWKELRKHAVDIWSETKQIREKKRPQRDKEFIWFSLLMTSIDLKDEQML